MSRGFARAALRLEVELLHHIARIDFCLGACEPIGAAAHEDCGCARESSLRPPGARWRKAGNEPDGSETEV